MLQSLLGMENRVLWEGEREHSPSSGALSAESLGLPGITASSSRWGISVGPTAAVQLRNIDFLQALQTLRFQPNIPPKERTVSS